jgi:hypothetical protein
MRLHDDDDDLAVAVAAVGEDECVLLHRGEVVVLRYVTMSERERERPKEQNQSTPQQPAKKCLRNENKKKNNGKERKM